MGPDPAKRSDDPKESRDRAFTKSGLQATGSAVAELIEKQGGITADEEVGTERQKAFRRLVARFAQNVRDAQGDQPRAYDADDWETGSDGKKKVKQGKPDPAAKQAVAKLSALSAEMEGEIAAAVDEMDVARAQPGRPKRLLQAARDHLADGARRLAAYQVDKGLSRSSPELAERLNELQAQQLAEMHAQVSALDDVLSARQ